MQETINRLHSTDHSGFEPTTGEGALPDREPAHDQQQAASEGVDTEHASSAVAGDGCNSSYFQAADLDTAAHRDAGRHREPHPQSAPSHSDLESTGAAERTQKRQPSGLRLILSVFSPFAAGYYLAYLFRTINGAIAPALAADFGIDAAQIGLLASVYFLVFGVTQIPIGMFLDRFGPRRVQSVLLIIAAGGATLFGNASGFPELLAARAMIGLGVAGSLMAGLKSIVTWFPRERVALVNGWMIMLGSLGAVTATAPTEWLLELVGWRDLFEVLTIGTVIVAGLIYLVVPEQDADSESATPSSRPLTLWSVYSDPRFLRVAPLSAACIGSSWALQSLWAPAWLTDVEGFDRQTRVTELLFMAIGLSIGALLLGTIADRLRKYNIRTEVPLAVIGGLFILAQLMLVLRVPLPSLLPWSVVSIAGAATVLSFAVIADYFPKQFAARANGALNLLHFGWAFVVQYGIGLVVGHWSSQDGHYPVAAYQTAFGLSLALQAVALIWFAIPWLRIVGKHLYYSFTRHSPENEGQPAFAAVAAEGAILETHPSTEW
jgi:predicted MFS family arabinose efflux permease